MKKIITVALLVLCFAVPVAAQEMGPYMRDPMEKTISWTASASSTVQSDVLDLFGLCKECSFFGIQYQALSVAGDADITTVEAHCSNDNSNFVEPEGANDFITGLDDENWHYDDLEIPPCRYLQFESVTGAAGGSDTVLTFKLYGWGL